MTILGKIYSYYPLVLLLLVMIAIPLSLGIYLVCVGQYAIENGKVTNKFIGYNNGTCIAGFVFIGIAILITIFFIYNTVLNEFRVEKILAQNRERAYSS